MIARRAKAAALAAALMAAAAPAAAQDLHSESVADEAPEEDETAWALSAGALLNTGNTRSWTVTSGTTLRLVRGRHGFAAESAFNYGQANLARGDGEGYQDTTRNLNSRGRYDFYLTDMDALFLALVHRWDTFAGLDTRLSLQTGYLRNFFKKEHHRFWGEVGYDMTYDDFDPDPLPNPDYDPTMPAGPGNRASLPGSDVFHSARLYLGYLNEVNENLTFTGGVESLTSFEDPSDTRLNADAALRSKINGNLNLELKFTLRWDNVPVDGFEELDTITQLTLIYNLI